MTRTPRLPDPSLINDDTPLQLHIAAQLAYPDGSMSVSGLRKERDRGTLAVERVANREYTTLGAIKRMRESCLVQQKAPASSSVRTAASGSSGTDKRSEELAALSRTVQRLRESSKTTSPKNTNRTSAAVIRLK
ncbi:excisionase [Labrys neptuniae]|uniref:Excisionase n=1 Tax=Labrys neptuniae TaxID=376174 RepID=A0ABV3PFT9_9HYPH